MFNGGKSGVVTGGENICGAKDIAVEAVRRRFGED
jgi:hypothetical protein